MFKKHKINKKIRSVISSCESINQIMTVDHWLKSFNIDKIQFKTIRLLYKKFYILKDQEQYQIRKQSIEG